MSHRDRPPLSRQSLKRLAQKQILGPEFLAEVTRIEKSGVRFDLHFGNGIPLSAVTALLLDYGVENPDYLALGVTPRRDEALRLARSDRSFLQVRLDDFRTRLGGETGDQIYVSDWHKVVLRAVAEQLGQGTPYYSSVYWSDDDPYSPGGDAWGHMAEKFIADIGTGKVSWLDLLRHKDANVRQYAAAYLADPADPESVATELIDHRLNHLESELERTLEHERKRAELRTAAATEQAQDRQVVDAWDGFFAGDGETAKKPLLSASTPRPVAPRHPRGVAEHIGDLDP